MASLWPWLAVAGLGALHGLNPATGWMLAAAWGVRSREGKRALQALVPIALGHLASVALVALVVMSGRSLDRAAMQAVALGLLVLVAAAHLSGHTPRRVRAPATHAGLALWSFLMSGAHGAGLMLVPALMPLCTSGASASAAGSLALALAAVGVHAGAMLAVTALLAAAACRGIAHVVRMDPRTRPEFALARRGSG